MKCPYCGFTESKVVDSRPSDDSTSIRRRRECLSCNTRFTTYERLTESTLVVKKSDGSSEAYNRQKLFHGILTACAKRPVSSDQIYSLIDDIEAELRNGSVGEIPSKDLGDMVLERLAGFDQVAYVRFASVYKDFQDINEFARTLEEMGK